MEQERRNSEQGSRPEPLPVNFERIPARLRNLRQFVVWRYQKIEDELKKPLSLLKNPSNLCPQHLFFHALLVVMPLVALSQTLEDHSAPILLSGFSTGCTV